MPGPVFRSHRKFLFRIEDPDSRRNALSRLSRTSHLTLPRGCGLDLTDTQAMSAISSELLPLPLEFALSDSPLCDRTTPTQLCLAVWS